MYIARTEEQLRSIGCMVLHGVYSLVVTVPVNSLLLGDHKQIILQLAMRKGCIF